MSRNFGILCNLVLEDIRFRIFGNRERDCKHKFSFDRSENQKDSNDSKAKIMNINTQYKHIYI